MALAILRKNSQPCFAPELFPSESMAGFISKNPEIALYAASLIPATKFITGQTNHPIPSIPHEFFSSSPSPSAGASILAV